MDFTIELFFSFLSLIKLVFFSPLGPPYIDDLEAILDEFFLKSLIAYVEDGSIEEVCTL